MEANTIISIDSKSLESLVDRLVDYVKKSHNLSNESKWICAADAKRMLGISSNTTLQQLRDQGKIRYSQPMHKVVLYDRNSILEFLEKHARNTF